MLGVAPPQPAREIVGGAHPPTRLATDANVEVDLGLWAWQLTRARERGERQQTQRTEHAWETEFARQGWHGQHEFAGVR